MTKIPALALILAAALSACAGRPKPPTETLPQPQAAQTDNSTLIVFYDAQTGAAPLLQAVQDYGASVVYNYQNFNAVAVGLPKNSRIEDAAAHFSRVPGVLSVNRNRILQLH